MLIRHGSKHRRKGMPSGTGSGAMSDPAVLLQDIPFNEMPHNREYSDIDQGYRIGLLVHGFVNLFNGSRPVLPDLLHRPELECTEERVSRYLSNAHRDTLGTKHPCASRSRYAPIS